MEKKTRTFEQTRRLAKHLGEKIKIIEDKMPYNPGLRGKSQALLAVSTAMTLIADTPNASINKVALAVFDRQIDEAIQAVKAWGKELFTPDEDDDSDDLMDDEIPF